MTKLLEEQKELIDNYIYNKWKQYELWLISHLL
jgi:hypothetical protein